MMNNYFNFVFTNTSGRININTNCSNAIDMASLATIVYNWIAMNYRYDNICRGAIYLDVLDQQNCAYINVVLYPTMQNFKITTEYALNMLNNMKTNKSP